MIIGICGNSGSGKSTLASILLNYYQNALHLDIDKIGHKSLTDIEVKRNLINRYGPTILDNENNIERKKLSIIVFNSKEEMSFLEEVTWNYMENEINKIIDENAEKIIILDWILLSKTKFFDMCSIKILLDIPYELRKERAIKRDNITEEAFSLRDKSSIEYNHQMFDYIINSTEISEIKRMVKSL